MSGSNLKTLETAIATGFCDLADGEAMTSIDSNLTNTQLADMAYEASNLPDIFYREIGDWERVKRATLIPKGADNYPLGHLGKLVLPTSNKWTPSIHRFANHAASVINNAARAGVLPRDIDSLRLWRPNRVGINLMQGRNAEPAMIFDHTDPLEETGVVVALELIGHMAGKLSLIFSADVCATLGLARPIHSIHTDSNRLSVTLAQLQKVAPPNLPADWC